MRSFLMTAVFLLIGFVSFAQAKYDTSSVYFKVAGFELDDSARSLIDSLLAGFQREGISELQLNGYCDPRGSQAYNERLSNKRTRSVYDYLVHIGLPEGIRVTRNGFGEDRPLNENRTEEEMQQNRRVDLIWQEPVKATVPVEEEVRPTDTIHYFSEKNLDSVREGETLRLKNINFYGGRHIFLPQSMPALNELLQIMKDHPSLVIEIQGHICCLWGERDGMDFDTNEPYLSRNRARAVYEYLAAGGIDRKRMSYAGFAGKKPFIYPERSEADKTLNRRVEIRIVKK